MVEVLTSVEITHNVAACALLALILTRRHAAPPHDVADYGVHMGSEFERLAAEKYVMVTTFRKNGDAVNTPVWAAGDDGELVVWSDRQAGKVKRIRNSGRVELQACDARGRKTHGEIVAGEARLLGDEATERTRSVIAKKYGIVGQVTMFFSRLRGRERTIGISIKLA
jgi:PPOX class probable F420-dependent enzyme